jgi:hypothetical protein
MSEPNTLRVRGEAVGQAFGLENWTRAEAFICDAFGRTATTPRWAFDATSAPSTGAPSGHHETNPGGALPEPWVGVANQERAYREHIAEPMQRLAQEQLDVTLRDLAKGTTGNSADLDIRDHEGWD